MAHRTDQSTYQLRGVDRPLGKKKRRRVKKQAAPPANTELIAPGAELPAPRQKKPHEIEADKPESYFSHEESVPMLDFDGSKGRGTVRGRIQKKLNIQREAEIVERIREVAILCEPEDAARLLPHALDLGNKLKTRYALNAVRAYIDTLAKKAQAADPSAKVEKRRVYLQPGEHAPSGYAEREGKRGGRFYEVTGHEDRHEPKPKMAHLGRADASVFDLVDSCADIARELGWFVQVDTVRAFDDREWGEKYKSGIAGPGGKTSRATPYANYNQGELGLSPLARVSLQSAVHGSRTHAAMYGVHAMAHELVHARNPIRLGDYYSEHALIEEALAEWLSVELTNKILTDRLGWGVQEANAVPEAYWDEFRALETIAGKIVGTSRFPKRDKIFEEVMRWKNMPPADRSYRLRHKLVGVLVREDFPDASDGVVDAIANANTQISNWHALWYSTGDRSRKQTIEGMQHSCYQAAKAMLAERGELPDWAKRLARRPKEEAKIAPRPKKTSEKIRADARARVKRWRERLKEEGRREKRVKKDFAAAPPADAMVGDDVGPMAVGYDRRKERRKKRREGIFDATGNQYQQKQLATGSVSSEDMGARTVLEVPDSACSKGVCEVFTNTYGSEILTQAVPQEVNPAYGSISVLYKVEADKEEREYIVGGYASPQVIDRERHLISREAMAKDLPRFLANPRYRNANLLHSNVQIGEVLPQWTDPKTGKTFRTEVDDIGLFCVIKVRTDKDSPPIVDQVIEDIEEGKLAAFSISGDAPLESREYTCKDGTCFWYISEIIFYEITLCEEGVNQDAKLVILSKSLDEQKSACPTCAGTITKAATTLINIAEGKIHASYTDAMDKLRELGHLDREERIALSDAITVALKAFGDKVKELGLDTRKVPAEDAALIVKSLLAAGYIKKNERVRLTERMMEGIAHLDDKALGTLVNDAFPQESDTEGSESKQALREKVEAVAEGAGEEDAIQMLRDVQEAEDKAGSPGGAGPTTTGSMQDFGSSVIERTHARDKCMRCDLPPTVAVEWAEGKARSWFCDDHWAEWVEENPGEDVHWAVKGEVSKGVPVAAPWMDDLILDEVYRYKEFLEAGAEPEEAYDKCIEEAGRDKPWFGTRQDEFGYWLLHVAQDGLPIPDVRLRVDPRESGKEKEPDPHWTAPSLLDVWKEALAGWSEQMGKAGGALTYEGIVAPHKPHEEGDVVIEVQGRGAVMRAWKGGLHNEKVFLAKQHKVYLQPGETVPAGREVKEGPRGGRYIEVGLRDKLKIQREREKGKLKEEPTRGGIWDKYHNAPKPPAVTEKRRKKLWDSLAQQGRLNDDGTVSLWHVTFPDRAEKILEDGFVPAKESAAGQPWQATHSSYATYFHADKEAALENARQAQELMQMDEIAISVVEARIPIDAESLRRIIPDEDVTLDTDEGLDVLERGEAVAVIGGWPAEWLREIPSDSFLVAEGVAKVLEPRDQLADIDQQHHQKDVHVKVGAPSYVARARTYLEPGEEAPAGTDVQEGPRGGRYYEPPGKRTTRVTPQQVRDAVEESGVDILPASISGADALFLLPSGKSIASHAEGDTGTLGAHDNFADMLGAEGYYPLLQSGWVRTYVPSMDETVPEVNYMALNLGAQQLSVIEQHLNGMIQMRQVSDDTKVYLDLDVEPSWHVGRQGAFTVGLFRRARGSLESIVQYGRIFNMKLIKSLLDSRVMRAEGTATPSKPIAAPSMAGGEGKPLSPEASEDPVQERAEGSGGLGVPQPGGRVKKGRRYLGEGEEAPAGVEVQEGPQGGRYYENGGRRGDSFRPVLKDSDLNATGYNLPDKAEYALNRYISHNQSEMLAEQLDIPELKVVARDSQAFYPSGETVMLYRVTERGRGVPSKGLTSFTESKEWAKTVAADDPGHFEVLERAIPREAIVFSYRLKPEITFRKQREVIVNAEALGKLKKGTEPLDTIVTTPFESQGRTPEQGVTTPNKDYTAKTETNEGVPGSHDESDTRGAPVTLAEVARAVRVIAESTLWLASKRHDANSDLPVTTIGKRGKRRWPSPLELVNMEIRRSKKRMVGHCNALWKEDIELDDWEMLMQKEIDDVYGKAASAGIRRAGDIEGARAWARNDLLVEMRDQRRWLAKFRTALATKGISQKRLNQRARMYADGAAGLYHSIVSGTMPARKAYWRLAKGAAHCGDCEVMAANSPYPSNNIPRLPRDGTTKCAANCACYLSYGPLPKMKVVPRKKT